MKVKDFVKLCTYEKVRIWTRAETCVDDEGFPLLCGECAYIGTEECATVKRVNTIDTEVLFEGKVEDTPIKLGERKVKGVRVITENVRRGRGGKHVIESYGIGIEV